MNDRQSSRPPRFQVRLPQKALADQRQKSGGKLRGSPRARGYDSKWDRLSVAFRRAHPYCRFCEQIGRVTLTAVADHIIPAEDRPDLKYAWKNLEPLCSHHHDGLKQRMEIYARENGLLNLLPEWCADPESRPDQFRIFAR